MSQPLDTIREDLVTSKRSGLTLKAQLAILTTRESDNRRKAALKVIDVLDSFNTKFARFEDLPADERKARKVLMSFKSIGQQLSSILTSEDIEEVDLSGGIPKIGFTKIVDTVKDSSLIDGTIHSIVKTGYEQNGVLIRDAEVIIVKNV